MEKSWFGMEKSDFDDVRGQFIAAKSDALNVLETLAERIRTDQATILDSLLDAAAFGILSVYVLPD